MSLDRYFEENDGTGVLSTADETGRVNTALYATPHFMEDGTLAFIMRDRLTHANLQSNPHAAYLFIESGPGYRGKRFYLTKVAEEADTERLYSLRKRTKDIEKNPEDPKFLVFFNLDNVLPLVGDGLQG
jgi:pyridoxamine 5'-phosphate oxidase-like protein